MADVGNLLSRLDKVKRTGEGKWMACCPAHDDRTPSLAIKCIDDKILIHCFSACSVHEIVKAVGLELADLMPENPSYQKGSKPPKFNKYELFDKLAHESSILLLAINWLLNKKTLSNADLLRVKQAESSMSDILREVRR